MKKFAAVALVLLLVTGCTPRSGKDQVRNKHAQLYVWVQRINDPDEKKHPTPAQNEDMLRSCLKDFESLDRMMNNWKPASEMPAVDLNGKPSTIGE